MVSLLLASPSALASATCATKEPISLNPIFLEGVIEELEDEDELKVDWLLDTFEQPTISKDKNVEKINVLLFFIKNPHPELYQAMRTTYT
jgi:hypothetical protein